MKLIFLLIALLGIATASPFDYDLHLTSIPGKKERAMICFHGYGANYKIMHAVQRAGVVDATLVSFNFPDCDILTKEYDPFKTTFGTIEELLPALYVLKNVIIDQGVESVELYGFSAGGGAVINTLAVLNGTTYDERLEEIGLGKGAKEKILEVVQKGLVILDTPLKSVEEILDLRGPSEELEAIAKNYRENGFRPIDSVAQLEGLSLTVILHFQEKDEVLFNRDDALFIEHLQKANRKGTTHVVLGNDGGHNKPHHSLWKFYVERRFLENRKLSEFRGKRIGYYTGSFDPFHLGHEKFIEKVLEEKLVDYVLIYPVPGGDLYKQRSDWELRKEMSRKVYREDPRILFTDLSPIQLQELLAPSFDAIEVIGLIGSDIVLDHLADPNEVHKTKVAEVFMRGKKIPGKHANTTIGAVMALPADSFIISVRSGDDVSEIEEYQGRRVLARLKVDEPYASISSTAVRKAVQEHQSIAELVDPEVQNLIESAGLY